jgi:hypothetical protein
MKTKRLKRKRIAQPGGSLKPVGSAGELLERIREYLTLGGLFNPEMMEHDKVRDLIMDCREYITRTQPNDRGQR